MNIIFLNIMEGTEAKNANQRHSKYLNFTERRITEHIIASQKRMQYSRASHWIYPTGCMTKCKITRLLEQTYPLLTSEIALHVMSRRWCNSLAFSYFTCRDGKDEVFFYSVYLNDIYLLKWIFALVTSSSRTITSIKIDERRRYEQYWSQCQLS